MKFCNGALMDSFHAVKKIPSMSFARKVKITSRGQILTSYFIALIEITIEIFSLNHLMWGEFQFTNSFFQNFTCNNKIFQISRKKQNDMVILVNDNISAPLNDTFHFIQTTCPTNTPEASLFYLFSLPPSLFTFFPHSILYPSSLPSSLAYPFFPSSIPPKLSF